MRGFGISKGRGKLDASNWTDGNEVLRGGGAWWISAMEESQRKELSGSRLSSVKRFGFLWSFPDGWFSVEVGKEFADSESIRMGFTLFPIRKLLPTAVPSSASRRIPRFDGTIYSILTHEVDLGGLVEKGGTGVTPLSTGRNIFFFYCVRKSCAENFNNRLFWLNLGVFWRSKPCANRAWVCVVKDFVPKKWLNLGKNWGFETVYEKIEIYAHLVALMLILGTNFWVIYGWIFT